MNRILTRIIICVAAIGIVSCSRFERVDALDVVGDGARVAAVADLVGIVKSTGGESTSVQRDFPELSALSALRGVDFKRVVAVSYTPSTSAVVMSIVSPRAVARTLPKISRDGVLVGQYAVRRLTDVTYMVVDSVCVWMVDSADGPEGAAAKVDRLLAESSRPLARWKREFLDGDNDIKAICAFDDRYAKLKLKFEKSGAEFNALCVDSADAPTWWFPADVLGRLPLQSSYIDPRNAFAFAAGRMKIDSILAMFPGSGRAPDDLAEFGPVNVAVSSPSTFRAIFDNPTAADATRLAEAARRRWGGLPGVAVECGDTLVEVRSAAGYPGLDGTSYAGCNAVVSLNLPSDRLRDFFGVDSPGITVMAVVRGASVTARADFLDTDKPFLANLFSLIYNNGTN